MPNTSQPHATGFFPWWFLEHQPGLMEWLDRQRQRARLAQLEARMLDDIGVTRAAAEQECRLWT